MRYFKHDELEEKALSFSSRGSYTNIRKGVFSYFGPYNDSSILDFSSYSTSHLRNLSRINIRYSPIDSLDLSPLKECKNLQLLDIQFTNIEEIDLSPLQFTNVKQIIITNNLINELDLFPLNECTSLKSLNISFNNLISIDLAQISKLFTLESLFLDGNNFDNLDLSPLERLELNSISFPSFSKKTSFNLIFLRSQNRLKSLSYSSVDSTGSELQPLFRPNRTFGYVKILHFFSPNENNEINSRCKPLGSSYDSILYFDENGEEITEEEAQNFKEDIYQKIDVFNRIYRKKE